MDKTPQTPERPGRSIDVPGHQAERLRDPDEPPERGERIKVSYGAGDTGQRVREIAGAIPAMEQLHGRLTAKEVNAIAAAAATVTDVQIIPGGMNLTAIINTRDGAVALRGPRRDRTQHEPIWMEGFHLAHQASQLLRERGLPGGMT